MRRGLWAPEASAPGWFDVTSYSEEAWFDEEAAFQPSIGGAAPLPHLSMLFEGSYVLDATDIPAFMRSYDIEPSDAEILRATRFMSLAAGSYTWTGVAAGLNYSSVNSSRNPAPLPHIGMMLDYSNILTAAAGSYAISGSATLKSGRLLTGTATSYTYTGVAATLTKVGSGSTPQYPAPLPHIGLIMAPNVVTNSVDYPASLPSLSSIMGRADGTYAMNGSPGLYTWTGQAALFSHGYQLTAETGTFVTDFSRVARDYQITCNAGGYTLTGNAATIGRVFTLTCSPTTFAITGVDVSLRYEQPGTALLNALAGVFVWEGFEAFFSVTRVLSAEPGTFLISGQAASYLLNGVAPVAPTTSAGSGKRKKKHYLEIEGEYLEVEDEEHALEILESLRNVAQKAIQKAKAPPKKNVVKASRDAPQKVVAEVQATNEWLTRMYAEAMQEEAEIEELISIGVL